MLVGTIQEKPIFYWVYLYITSAFYLMKWYSSRWNDISNGSFITFRYIPRKYGKVNDNHSHLDCGRDFTWAIPNIFTSEPLRVLPRIFTSVLPQSHLRDTSGHTGKVPTVHTFSKSLSNFGFKPKVQQAVNLSYYHIYRPAIVSNSILELFQSQSYLSHSTHRSHSLSWLW